MKKLEILYKKTELNQIQEWKIVVSKNTFYTEEGILNSKITKSIPTICEGKNPGKKNETTLEDQAYKEALSRWKKKQENGYHINIDNVDNKSLYFEPMLAKKYKDEKDKVVFPVYCQPKLYGGRCVAKKDNLYTRNGKVYVSIPHIFEELKSIFDKHPQLILDGEIYADKLNNDFNKIMSLAKKTKPFKEDLEESKSVLKYHVYDFPSVDGNFSKRYEALKQFFKENKFKYIELVETHKVDNEKQLDDLYNSFLSKGYEGQTVRLNIKPYENKRVLQLLKRKEFIDEEYIIKDILEGKGNRSGMAGRMVFETKDKQIIT
jgi:DNA ligase-1